MQKKNILVVDDDDAFLFAVKKLFAGMEVSVFTAATLEEALKLVRELEFDIVITDIRLTKVNSKEGIDLLQSINELNTDTKVIILTGCGNTEIRDQVYGMGACLYLEKPLSIKILITIVRTHLECK